ncbi:MAG: RNase adapter RapZ [Pyrinomonadaceae bacterium]
MTKNKGQRTTDKGRMTVKRYLPPNRELPDVVIITGLSGSGMSSATNAFEDLSYFCVDNLPMTLLPTFARLLTSEEEKNAIERAALVINIRERQFLTQFTAQLEQLTASGLRVFVLFLEASAEILQRRFSETRRPHPADDGNGLQSAIIRETEAMQIVRQAADLIIDTSEHSVHSLRRLLIEKFNPADEQLPLRVQIISFGHKYGTPRDLDLQFDVRHLPNPFFVPQLRPLSGSHPSIVQFLKAHQTVKETIVRFLDLLAYLLPFYQREGKAYLSIGIGCTGGRHRSVMVANSLGKELRRLGFEVQINHRDSRKTLKKNS